MQKKNNNKKINREKIYLVRRTKKETQNNYDKSTFKKTKQRRMFKNVYLSKKEMGKNTNSRKNSIKMENIKTSSKITYGFGMGFKMDRIWNTHKSYYRSFSKRCMLPYFCRFSACKHKISYRNRWEFTQREKTKSQRFLERTTKSVLFPFMGIGGLLWSIWPWSPMPEWRRSTPICTKMTGASAARFTCRPLSGAGLTCGSKPLLFTILRERW